MDILQQVDEGCELKYNVNEDDMVCIPHDMSIALESLDDLMIFRRFRRMSCQIWLQCW
jgi:hypothetical protein